MNKRQIKKQFQRINGFNPKYRLSISQMKRCCTNSLEVNRVRYLVYSFSAGYKKMTDAIVFASKSFYACGASIRNMIKSIENQDEENADMEKLAILAKEARDESTGL